MIWRRDTEGKGGAAARRSPQLPELSLNLLVILLRDYLELFIVSSALLFFVTSHELIHATLSQPLRHA